MDAPLDLPASFVMLRPEIRATQTGIGIVRDLKGRAWKIMLTNVEGNAMALERRVTLRYEPIPSKANGGLIVLKGQPQPGVLEESTSQTLKKMLNRSRVPGDTFKSFLGRSYTAVKETPSELDLPRGLHLALTLKLESRIRIPKRGSIYASRGIGPNGVVEIESYSGVLVNGDLRGHIKVGSYAYIHITGDLIGTLDCDSYTTVLVDGDIIDTLKVRSYLTFYLGGQFASPTTNLDTKGSCWSTFYFSSYSPESYLLSFPPVRQFTLHARDSDLSDGLHDALGPWRKVVVADTLWVRL